MLDQKVCSDIKLFVYLYAPRINSVRTAELDFFVYTYVPGISSVRTAELNFFCISICAENKQRENR